MPTYSDKTFNQNIQDQVDYFQNEDTELAKTIQDQATIGEQVSSQETYEAGRDYEIAKDNTKIKDTKPQEDTGKVAEYWNKSLDFLGGPESLRAIEVHNGRTYDARNKRPTIYADYSKEDLINEVKNIKEDPNAKHVLYNIKYYVGKDKNGDSKYAYKTGVDTVSAFNRYKEQLGNDVQIVFEKRFAGAEDAENRFHQLEADNGTQLASNKQEAYKEGIGSFGSGYTEFTNEDYFGGDNKTLQEFSDAKGKSEQKYDKDIDYRDTHNTNNTTWDIIKGGDYSDAFQSGAMSLVGGIGDAVATGLGFGLNELGLRNNLSDTNWFHKLKENADKYSGYDRRSSTQAMTESTNLWNHGKYVQALWNNKWDLSDSIVESLPEMLVMTAGLPEAGAVKLVKGLNEANKALRVAQEAGDIKKVTELSNKVKGLTSKFKDLGEDGIKAADTLHNMSIGAKISSVIKREAGFEAVVAKNTNNVIEDRIEHGDDNISTGEFAGILASQFLSTATDRFAFKEIVGDSKILGALKETFKDSSDEVKKSIIHKVASVATGLGTAGVVEGVQEYLQTWSEITGAQLGVKGKTLEDVLTDKDNQNQAIGAAIAGAVGGGTMHSAVHGAKGVVKLGKIGTSLASDALERNNIKLDTSEEVATQINSVDDFNSDDFSPESKMMSIGLHLDSTHEHNIDGATNGVSDLITNVMNSVKDDKNKSELFKEYLTQKLADNIYNNTSNVGKIDLSNARELGLNLDSSIYNKALENARDLISTVTVEHKEKELNKASKSQGSDTLGDTTDVTPDEGYFEDYRVESSNETLSKDAKGRTENPFYGKFDTQIASLNKQISAMNEAGLSTEETTKYRDALVTKNTQKFTPLKTFDDVVEDIENIGFRDENGIVDPDKHSLNYYNKSLPLSVSSFGYDENNLLSRFVKFSKSRISKSNVIKEDKLAKKVLEENLSLLGIAIKALNIVAKDTNLTSKQKHESKAKILESIDSINTSNRGLLDRELGRIDDQLSTKENNPELDGSYVVSDEVTKQAIMSDLSEAKSHEDINNIKNRISGINGTLPIYFNNKDGSDIMMALTDAKDRVSSKPTEETTSGIDGAESSIDTTSEIPNSTSGGTNIRTDYGKINFISSMRNFLTTSKIDKPINTNLFEASVKSLLAIKQPEVREAISKKLSTYALTDAQIGTLYDALNHNKEDYSDTVNVKEKTPSTRDDYNRLTELRSSIKTLVKNISSSNKDLDSIDLKNALDESLKELQELSDEIVAMQNSLDTQEKNLSVDKGITLDNPEIKSIKNLYLKSLKIIKSLYNKLVNVKASKKELSRTFRYLQKTVKQIDKRGKVNKLSVNKAVRHLGVLERTISKRIENLDIPTVAYRDEIKIASDLEKHSDKRVSSFAKNVKNKLLKKDNDHKGKMKAFQKLNDFALSKDKEIKAKEAIPKNTSDDVTTNKDVVKSEQPKTVDNKETNNKTLKKEPTTSEVSTTKSSSLKDRQYSSILSFLFNVDIKALPKSFKWSEGLPDTSNEAIPQEWNTKSTHNLLNAFKVNFNGLKVLLSKEVNDTRNAHINSTLDAMKKNTQERLDTLFFDLKNNERKTHDKLVDKNERKGKKIISLEKSLFNLHKSLDYYARTKEVDKFYETYKNILKKEISLQKLTFKKALVDISKYKDAAKAIGVRKNDESLLNSLEAEYNNKTSMLTAKLKSSLKLARLLVSKFFNQKKRILEKIKKEEEALKILNETISTFNYQNKISDELMDKLESRFIAKKVKESTDVRVFSNGDRIVNWFNKYNPKLLDIFEPSKNPISKISNLLTSGKPLSQIEEEFIHENLSESSFNKLTLEDLNNIAKLNKVVNGFVGSKEGNVEVDNGSFLSSNGTTFNIANIFRRFKDGSKVTTQADVHNATKLVNGLVFSAMQEVKYTILKMDNDDITKNFNISGTENIIAFRNEIIHNNIPLASIREDLASELKTLIGLKVKNTSDEQNSKLYDATVKTIIESVLQESPMYSLSTKKFSATQSYKLVTINSSMLDSNFSEEEKSDIKNSFSKLSYLTGDRKKGHPSHKPHKISDKIRNGVIKLLKQDLEKLTKLNNTSYVYSKRFKKVAEVYENDKELAYSMFGKVTDKELSEMTIEDYTTAKSVNEQIERDLDNLYKYYNEFKDKDFFLPYGVTKSNRTQIFSDITPMDSKIHREFIIKKSFVKEISPHVGNYREPLNMRGDNFSDEELFEIALSEAFDLDPDKKGRFQLFKDIRDIVDIYSTDGVKIKDKKFKFIKDFIENPVEDLSLLATDDWSKHMDSHKRFHAILELRNLHQNKLNGKQTTTHDLTLEADAITSGTGILTLQSGLSKENQELMEKAGILNDKQLHDRTIYTKKLLAHKHNVSEDDIEMSMPSLIEAGDYHYDLIVDDSFDTSSLDISDDDVYLDIYKTMGSDVMNEGFDNDKIDGQDSDIHVRAFEMAKLELMSLALEKGLPWFRKLSKPPVMTFNYGSSISSIKKDIRNKTFDSMFLKSLRGDNKYANLVIIAAHNKEKNINRKGWSEAKNKEYNKKIIKDYWSNTSRNFFIPDIYKDTLDLNNREELSKYAIVADSGIIKILQEQSDVLLGDKFETSFDNRMNTITKYREALQHMDIIHAETFKFLFEKEIENLRDNKKLGIDAEEQYMFAKRAETENLQDLEKEYQERTNVRDTRLTAQDITKVLDTMNTDGFGYTLSLFNRIQEFYKTADAKQESVERSYFKGDGQKNGISYEAQVEEFIANFRAYPTTSIHNIDDEQMRKALLANDFSSIYDAIIFPSEQNAINKTTDVYNKGMIDTNRDNSIMTSTVAKLNTMITRIKDLGLESEFYNRFNMFDKSNATEIYTDKVIVSNGTDPIVGIYNGKTANNRKLQTLPDKKGTRKVETYTVRMSESRNSFSISQNIKAKDDGNIEVTRYQYTKVDNEYNAPLYNLKIVATSYNFKARKYDFKRDRLVGEVKEIMVSPHDLESHETLLNLNNETIKDLTSRKVPLINLHTEKRQETTLKSEMNLKDNSLHEALRQIGFLNNGVDFKVDDTVNTIHEVNNGRQELSNHTLHVNHMAVLGTQFKQVEPSESKDVNKDADVNTVEEMLSNAQNNYIKGTVDYLATKYPNIALLQDISNITDGLVDISPIINDESYMDFSNTTGYKGGLEEYQNKIFNPNLEYKYTVELVKGKVNIIDNEKSTVDDIPPVIEDKSMDIIESYLNDPDRGC